MVLIDSSVWIDFFGKGETQTSERLEGIIANNNQAYICGIILQEVLQGIRSDKEYALVNERLSKLPFINTNYQTYQTAALLYRTLRKKGVTIPSIDITFASTAIQNGLKFWTLNLEHFNIIARYSALELFQ